MKKLKDHERAGAKRKGEVSNGGASAADNKLITAITISGEDWRLLRAVAFRRAQEVGGRPSVSRLLAELISDKRAALEREAGPYLNTVK
jgi:hypothetical protein